MSTSIAIKNIKKPTYSSAKATFHRLRRKIEGLQENIKKAELE